MLCVLHVALHIVLFIAYNNPMRSIYYHYFINEEKEAQVVYVFMITYLINALISS